MYGFLFNIWGIFFISFISGVLSQSSCSTLPISVSSLDICEDSSCRTSETAQLRLELNKGSTTCIRVEATSTQVAPALFNITIVDAVLSYPLVDCYFSDDPQIDISSFCGCPGGTTVSCNSCSAASPSGVDVLCTSGLHNSKGCLLGGAGTWCSKVGFSGSNRYKICDIGDPELQLAFQYFDTMTMKTQTVTNPIIVTSGNSVLNITMLDFVISDREKTEFLVWDTRQQSNFYLVPERFVNFHDTYDPSKLGWFKSNKSTAVTNKFFESTNSQIVSCSQNKIAMGTSAVFLAEFLQNNPNYCAQRVAPGTILRDPGFPLLSAMTGEAIEVPTPFTQGSYFTSITGDLVFFGLDTDGNVHPSPYWAANGWSIDTIAGDATTGDYLCSNGTHMWTDTDFTYNLVVCQQLDNSGNREDSENWGVCVVTNDIATGDTTYICTNIQFIAYSWPDGTLQTYTFTNTTGFKQVSNNAPKINEASDAILVPVKKGSATLLVEFKNVTFVFDTINAIPHIDSLDDSSGDVIVFASSKTVPGNCVLMISNDLGPTISVFLSLVNNKYRIPITTNKFHGKAVITLQCFKSKDSVSLDINVDKGDPQINEKSINQTDVREASMNDPSFWSKFVRSATKTSNFLGSIFSTIFSLTGNAVGSFFLGLLIILASIAAVPLILIIIWKLVGYIYYKLRMRKPTGPNITRTQQAEFKLN